MILKLTVFLCVVWAATLLYGEKFAFWLPSHWTCSWPPINGVSNSSDNVKIAVLADPQLMDRTSHNLPPKSLALEIAQFYTDMYMRRAILSSVMPLKPDVVLFLGDYFDGGPILSDEEWQDSLSRFRHTFHLKILEETTNHQVYFISGNHDIGYAAFHSYKPEVIKRYEKVFGLRNYRFTVGEVEFIAVDAQTLDGLPQREQTSATWNFVKSVSRDSPSSPRVLLTHIPLYRPDWTSCGSKRSSPVINQRISRTEHEKEIVYQNYLTEETTQKLLDSIKPTLVLSGHDHDQCTVTHMSIHGPVTEHTLGTISWQQGNLYPSFMLLSAINQALFNASGLEDATSTHLCFLPVQLFIYIWYLSLFVLSILAALLWPTISTGFLQHFSDFMSYFRGILAIFNVGTKAKDEDDNCEYEMVWDAEGSMHLIKKTSKSTAIFSNEKSTIERGNAVMRPAARKQILEEINVLMPPDLPIQMGSDVAVRSASTKTRKFSAKLVIRSFVRVFLVISVVAAVNLPIYVMMLFNDWIDK